jgi:hypothetical protein
MMETADSDAARTRARPEHGHLGAEDLHPDMSFDRPVLGAMGLALSTDLRQISAITSAP